MIRPLALLALLVALPAWAQPTKGGVYPRPHTPPVLKLLEPGAEPRAPLRYAWKAPQAVAVTAAGRWRVTDSSQSNGVAFPTLTTPIRLVPSAKAGEVDFVFQKPSGEPGPGMPGALDTITAHILVALEGVHGTIRLDPRGVLGSLTLYPSRNDPEFVDGGSMQKRSLYATQMAKTVLVTGPIPFPEEPVGVGARWSVERVVPRGPLSLVQVSTYTLERVEGRKVFLSTRIGAKFDPGSGLRPEELQLEVSGGGRAVVDLGLPLPTTLDETLAIAASVGRAGEPQTNHEGAVTTHVETR